MGGEVASQIMENWLTNVSVSLQTPSPSSSLLLACSAWKGFVMEDIHGQEGSEDRGPGAIAATCLDVNLKGQPTNNPNVQPSKLSISVRRVHRLFGVGGIRSLPGLRLIREPQTTAATGWCQWELRQRCAGCTLCHITSEACHSSHIHCCTHPIMKEALAACPAPPTFASLSWIKLQSKHC